jgi:hypothetical protein
VSDTLRGVIVFVTVLVTIGIWAPLRNKPERLPNGTIQTDTYFGVLRYLTLRTLTREPKFEMEWYPDYKRVGMTALLTVAIWGTVGTAIRKRKAPASSTSVSEN